MLKLIEEDIVAWLREVIDKPRDSLDTYAKDVLVFVTLFNILSREWANLERRELLQSQVNTNAQVFFGKTYPDQTFSNDAERVSYRTDLLAIIFRGIFITTQIRKIEEGDDFPRDDADTEDEDDKKDDDRETAAEADTEDEDEKKDDDIERAAEDDGEAESSINQT